MTRTTVARRIAIACIAAGSFAVARAAGPAINNPTGTAGLLLVDKVGHHIRFFDPSTRAELSSFEAGINPHDLAISPDHKLAYIPIYGDGVYGRNPNPGHEVAIVDLAARKQVGTIDVSPYQAPHGIQIDANGLLYVTCDLSRKMLVIDPKKRTIEAAIDTEGTGHWVAILPDASKAYVANKNDRLFVTVIDLKSRKVIGRIPAPKGTQGIVASPDGKRVVAVDYADPALMVIDTATDKVIERVQLEGTPRAAFKAMYSPDGSKLLVCWLGDGVVNILNAAKPSDKQRTIAVGKDPMGFAFSADGRTALVANHGDGTVSVIDLQSAKVTSTFKGGTGIETLTYF
jgi:YVTN family beta-propeller protein